MEIPIFQNPQSEVTIVINKPYDVKYFYKRTVTETSLSFTTHKVLTEKKKKKKGQGGPE